MNKQELIKEVKEIGIYGLNIFGTVVEGISTKTAIELIKQLDEPEAGHADEAPRYVKNILARLRELPLHDREVWLKAIMGEFEQDFSHAKWREGYEQGKFEGEWVGNQLKDADKVRRELNKPVIPQFVADWIEECKDRKITLAHALYHSEEAKNKSVYHWLFEESGNQEKFARAWIFGYEVEEEKRYLVKVKGMSEENTYLTFRFGHTWMLSNFEECEEFRLHHTRKELEDANFSWIFDCPGIEIEEVE